MPLNNPIMGFHNVPAYQVSGLPFVTSSVIVGLDCVQFDYVSRWIMVQNTDAGDIRIGFTENGIEDSNYYTVQAGENTPQMELRADRIYVSGTVGQTYELMVGLTCIPAHQMDRLTGSNGHPGIG